MARGRPREFDRDKALQAAMLVFWRKGFLGASVSDLCAAMGIASPSLYAAFGSKESLYVEAVEHYSKTIRPFFWRHLESGQSARASMKKFLFEAAKGLRRSGKGPVGCMVTLSVLDEDVPAPVAASLRKARREGLDLIRRRLEAAVADGELPPATDVNRLSRFYVGIFQTLAIQGHDGATLAELEGIAAMAMAAWPQG
jgi:AcrR family transcriptional regulator